MQDPIIALATPNGVSAIAVIRLSGRGVIYAVNQVFKGKDLTQQASHTIHFGVIRQGQTVIDEVLVSIFIAPHSFTKEDSVEISCHGSPFIVAQLIELFVARGVRVADPGEFTKRAFLNGRFDLTQAEAVADLIAANSALTHQIALNQMRGGFSSQLQELRKALIHMAALLELELDFSEEDIALVDRIHLKTLTTELLATLQQLIESFKLGNVIKNGIAVTILGAPNVGKSTLLNALLQEERAIVSPIAGTTRDTIEGHLNLDGLLFRFVDTAGLREKASDDIEAIGIERAKQQASKALVVLYLVDLSCMTVVQAEQAIATLNLAKASLIKIGNKMDIASSAALTAFKAKNYLLTAAQTNEGIDKLKSKILNLFNQAQIQTAETVVVNARHYERLQKSKTALEAIRTGLEEHLPNELLASAIQIALHSLGEITGTITTEEILGEIFSKFCIGK
ncbi:tRNA uridine-5-carboxymethylaminomethyl(34) synthesis GTPase MnmE [Candidatus Cardinium hertigii]|uniref:tRNA modification GTPase MnmE n=1 Tax=Candidatus Cardinium hertigii TaxID=247481 RepID=A0A2Z3LHU8_9BACT|nr:tRNA uridine-5-carboxymethylaminomethyl(34) synthesis GTPase MnmE [Candidatus Cardinium hertigii]AWN82085.1 tRNA modification GTPase MnmE [Candidatus Cardinium hertigii]